MNKNINAVVELTEKELACVTGGRRIVGGEGEKGHPVALAHFPIFSLPYSHNLTLHRRDHWQQGRSRCHNRVPDSSVSGFS